MRGLGFHSDFTRNCMCRVVSFSHARIRWSLVQIFNVLCEWCFVCLMCIAIPDIRLTPRDRTERVPAWVLFCAAVINSFQVWQTGQWLIAWGVIYVPECQHINRHVTQSRRKANLQRTHLASISPRWWTNRLFHNLELYVACTVLTASRTCNIYEHNGHPCWEDFVICIQKQYKHRWTGRQSNHGYS